MTIAFNEIPADVRVPWTYIEFDPTRAAQGPSVQPYKILLLGQKLPTGLVPELTLTKITSADAAGEAFGFGSQIHGSAIGIFANNQITEVTAIAIDDAGGAVKATGTVTFSAAATENGSVFLYIAGRRVVVPVTTTSTPTQLGDALVAEIAKDTSIPVSAVNVAGTVTLTAGNGGTLGNTIDLRRNYLSGERTPAGLGVAIVQMSGGSTDPDVSEIAAALDDAHYNVWVNPWTDSANLALLETELDARFGPTQQLEAIACMAFEGTSAAITTFGDGENSKHFCTLGVKNSPHPTWEIAGEIAGIVAREAQKDPARPLQTLELARMLPPAEGDRFTWTERDAHLRDGVSTWNVNGNGRVAIESLVTMYQVNAQSQADAAYRYVNSLLTLSYLRYDFRTHMLGTYPRHKLADDGTRFGAGQAVMTPSLGRAVALARFRQWEEGGLVEGFDQFKADLVVERNASDRNRLDFLMSPNLINGLRVVAGQFAFIN